MDRDKSWMTLPRWHHDYIKGVEYFLQTTFVQENQGDEFCCPCNKCVFRYYHTKDIVRDHLIVEGFIDGYDEWVFHGESDEINTDNQNDDGGFIHDDIDGMLHDMYRNVEQNSPLPQEDRGEAREEPNEDAKKFYKLVEEGQEQLYPGCTSFSKLSFTIRLYINKCVHGISNEAFDDLLCLLREAFPNAKLPDSFNDAKKTVKNLGLQYQKIHACQNDCMLYWKEHSNASSCHICGSSRWNSEGDNKEKITDSLAKKPRQIPAKVLWHFPLKPRLQRLFMCSETADLMSWHANKLPKDGNLRHPADGEAWKTLDALDPDFAMDPRNVRFGLSSDGFNPFRTMSSVYSTWPVVLINYNLPPWLSIKPEFLILSLLIQGPQSPGNNIDVYLQPLVEELKDLWEFGLEVYDASKNQTFQMRSALLWTISDFPAYAMLSGWSTKGKFACPSCNYETSSQYLKHSRKFCYLSSRLFLEEDHPWRFDTRSFNGKVEVRTTPTPLSGQEVLELTNFETVFGKKQRRKLVSDTPWKKRSIFFKLPYWEHNPCRHCLDVMHIEKNICENVLGTLLDIPGKTKDHAKARYDLKEMGIRKELQPSFCKKRKKTVFRAATFSMTDVEKRTFCSVLKAAKLPYACSSNISRFVQDKKLSGGYKSHDAHILMQYLLQVAVRKALPKQVALTLIRLGAFFKSICSKVIKVRDLDLLQREIVEILCQLEKIFPPSFFDVMVHLPIHLIHQIKLGGPVHFQWMYWMERYLCRLKSYVRNRSRPEGSIAEAYLADECLAFCSRYMHDRVKTRLNRYSGGQNSAETQSTFPFIQMGYPLGGKKKRGRWKKNLKGEAIMLDNTSLTLAHRYAVFNCGDEEVEKYIKEHKTLIDSRRGSSKWAKEKMHSQDFVHWFEARVTNEEVPNYISCLSKFPNPVARRYKGYCINGYKFYTRERDGKCKTQNSGVTLTATTPSFASSRDQNPIVGNVEYYGAIDDIIEIDYWGTFSVVLFRCVWFDVLKDDFGLTCVNFIKLCYMDDPFVLASQVHQVFYVQDPSEEECHYVLKNIPRDLLDLDQSLVASEESYWGEAINVGFDVSPAIGDDDTWCRRDVTLEMPFTPDDLDRQEIQDDSE